MLRKQRQYATLLRVRKTQENLKSREYADALREVRDAQNMRSELEDYQRRVLEQAAEAEQGTVRAPEVRDLLHYERHLAGLAVAKDADVRALREAAERVHGDLMKAVQARRMIERLAATQRRRDGDELRRKVQLATDESAVMRSHARVRTRGGEEDSA